MFVPTQSPAYSPSSPGSPPAHHQAFKNRDSPRFRALFVHFFAASKLYPTSRSKCLSAHWTRRDKAFSCRTQTFASVVREDAPHASRFSFASPRLPSFTVEPVAGGIGRKRSHFREHGGRDAARWISWGRGALDLGAHLLRPFADSPLRWHVSFSFWKPRLLIVSPTQSPAYSPTSPAVRISVETPRLLAPRAFEGNLPSFRGAALPAFPSTHSCAPLRSIHQRETFQRPAVDEALL